MVIAHSQIKYWSIWIPQFLMIGRIVRKSGFYVHARNEAHRSMVQKKSHGDGCPHHGPATVEAIARVRGQSP